jgi:hypothetical protein
MDIISKASFAARLGVSRARISQLISAKQIYGAALVGEGRTARIRVVTALEQLKRSLDIAQHLGGNGKARLDAPGSLGSAAAVTIEEQIKAERLLQLELMNDRARAEAAARNGRFTSTDGARQQMGRIASTLLNAFEGWLGQLATRLAEHFGLPQRDVLHVLRSEFRLFRASAAAAMRREAESLPELVADDLPDAGDDAPAPIAAP